MNQLTHGGADDLLTRVSGRLTRWVLGLGLLSLHATIFTISMVGLVLWNIYDSPSDLWVDEVFYRWSAVLAFHAIAVACGWAAWRLIRSEEAAVLAAQQRWSNVETRPAELRVYQPTIEANGWHDPAPAQNAAMQRYADVAHRAEDVARRALASSAAWSSSFARRTVSAVSNTATQLTHRSDGGESRSTASDPTQTWPENPIRHRPEDEEFISRFTGNQTTPAVDGVSVDQKNGTGTDIVLDVSGVSNRSETQPGATHHIGKDPGQSWVEAATSAWHGPHLSDSSTADNQQDERRDGSSPNTPTPQ
jgi:hypothetical protein